MPMPTREDTILPDGFDPEKHCGARMRKGKACMMTSGERTDHPGVGRCWLHGGKTPVQHGRNSKIVRQTVFERVEAMKTDPELLNLDKQLATMRVLFEMQLRKFSVEVEGYEALMEIIESQVSAGEAVVLPPDILPKMDMETVDMMVKLTKVIYDMRFSKKFSMPISAVQQLLMTLMDSFAVIAQKYNIPNEARAEFAHSIRQLRVVNTAQDDPQLMIAGGMKPVIDGRAEAVS